MSKTIVITGASDGIGAAAARRLHHDGHHVVLVGRSPAKTEAIARELGADHVVADFTRLDEVRRLADALTAAYPRIDVLANNAGGVFGDPTKTADGFEITFQVNHLAPFLLTTLLLDRLIESRASVIQTSSTVGMAPKIDTDDLNFDRNFNPVRVYMAAKLENVLFTRELHRRYHDRGITTAAFNPGNIASNFATRSQSPIHKFVATNRITRSLLLTTPDNGADQLVWLATTTGWQSGGYYVTRTLAKSNPQADDTDLTRRLWDRSAQLVA
ncbi:SDR family NAD(P)-dependent oxidoreductase [Catenuloplanes japonicus]|uniref:SDR family NAD(P)-dependent oxidoreductase n=1 Tax=Catenuloplanes japonicus TaxID=33876 RepID=UPI000524E325|nr:SDR family NAD(P)-dependent oxidoreductase [Catenuloplanes japonicus]